jgi:hypothetical protein
MVTMVDEIFDRGYQAARAELNAGFNDAFAGIVRTIGDGLRVMHRIEWSAPWTAHSKKTVRRT